MSVQKQTFCRICEPNCPILATLDNHGDIVRLEPNMGHPSKGVACHKGLSFLEVHRDPDRLDLPLRRRNARAEPNGDFESIGWDRALAESGARLKHILETHGPNAIAVYSGNPMAFNARLTVYAGEFQKRLNTQMRFGAGTQDMTNKLLGAAAIYGSFSLMVHDIANTDYLLCIGANPRVSKWTIVSAPNDSGRAIEAIKERGGKVRFVNPRKTESSYAQTGETLQIKPDTDVYFLAAVLAEIVRTNSLDTAAIERYGCHVEQLKAFVARYPAQRIAGITGIDASTIATVAAEIVAARSASIYLSTGVNQGRQGLLAYWLAEMITFVTGNLGREGGSYRPAGYQNDYPPIKINARTVDTSIGSFQLPKPSGGLTLPAALLADLVESGDIKALITLSGNPLLSVGGEQRMREAFKKLDVMVTVDISRNATAEISDYVLPATDFLERADINLFNSGLQSLPYAHYTDAIAQPAAERRDDWWIVARLAQEMGLTPRRDEGDGFAGLDAMLGDCGLSIDMLKQASQQTILLPSSEKKLLFENCLRHAGGRVDCYPQVFEEAGLFERCETIFQQLEQEPAGTLKLISLRTLYMQNSWMANVQKFRHGVHSINPLHICNADAQAHGLLDGDRVRVFNKHGSIESQVRINDELRPGAVAMSHGFGNGRPAMKVANNPAGANYNQLVPTGLASFEPLSHMSWLCGITVQIERLD